MSAKELNERLGWHPRAAVTALDALVAAGLLRRDKAGRYANTLRASTFLDREKSTYIGGLMELSSTRLYDLWSGLDDLLTTGVPAALEEHDENEFFDVLYRDPVALKTFLSGMTGISTGEVTLLQPVSRGSASPHSPIWAAHRARCRFGSRSPIRISAAPASTYRSSSRYSPTT
jgi:hypothetical protein